MTTDVILEFETARSTILFKVLSIYSLKTFLEKISKTII